MKVTYDLSIEANNQKEADAKIAALVVLAAKLNEKQLSKVAEIIKSDPIKTALALKYLGV